MTERMNGATEVTESTEGRTRPVSVSSVAPFRWRVAPFRERVG